MLDYMKNKLTKTNKKKKTLERCTCKINCLVAA